MIRIAVVDDIDTVCLQLEKILYNISEHLNIDIEVETYVNGEILCQGLKEGECFDLILLDIELQGMSGIEVSKFIRHIMGDELQQIVYISAKSEYSLELHNFHPLDFLIKEVSEEDVKKILIRYLKVQGKWNDYFEFKEGAELRKIKIKEIRYLTISNRISVINLNNNKLIQYYGTLESAYNEQLKQHGFLFLHKAYVVNPLYIEVYEYDKVTLNNGQKIPIGSSRRKEIRALQLRNHGRGN